MVKKIAERQLKNAHFKLNIFYRLFINIQLDGFINDKPLKPVFSAARYFNVGCKCNI